MFDFLLGVTAIAHAGMELLVFHTANNPITDKPSNAKSDYEKGLEYYDKQSDYKNQPKRIPTAIKQNEKVIWKTKTDACFQNHAVRRYEERHKNEKNPKNKLVEWVSSHDVLLLNVLSPGIHIIPLSEMGNMDIEEIADFLFKQECVESVEHVLEGLEVTVR